MNASNSFPVALLAAMLLSVCAFGEDIPDEFKCGPIDCDTIKDHPDLRIAKILLDNKSNEQNAISPYDKIHDLRLRFWASHCYPHNPGWKDHVKDREEFAQALFVKDLYYLQGNLARRMYEELARNSTQKQAIDNAMTEIAKLYGLEIDDGIPKAARPEFDTWVDSVYTALGPARSNDDILRFGIKAVPFVLGEDYRKAINLAGKEYQAYLMERDWAEYAAVDRLPLDYDTKEKYGIFAYFRFGKLKFHEANAIYADMKSILDRNMSESVVEAAADRVRRAKKTKGGLLPVTVAQPEKTGPGGSKLPDYDVPMPEDPVGVQPNPEVVMEILATQGDDHRYLLYWLKSQYKRNRNSLDPATTKWAYAELAYQALKLAYGGEHDVLEAAHKVRTATKRLTSGTVMDEKSIGATRNEPFEAIEDILARMNPRGYVRATILFSGKLDAPAALDPAALDAAYQKLISTASESSILETARIMSMDKPHFAYRGELDQLKKLVINPPPPTSPEILVDFPEYHAWKKFAPGAKVTYAGRIWVRDPRGGDQLVPNPINPIDYRHTWLLRSVNDEQALFWFTETIFDHRTAHPARDTEIAYPSKMNKPAKSTDDTTAILSRLFPARFAIYAAPTTGPTETGEEIIQIQGKKIATHWQSASYSFSDRSPDKDSTLIVKLWTSDEVPTRLIRRTEDKITPANQYRAANRVVSETFLESFEGFTPATPPADPSRPVSTAYTPPPLVTPPAPPTNNLKPASASQPAPQTPTRPPAPDRTRPARGQPQQPQLTPEAATQVQLIQRFTGVMTRAQKAKVELAQLEQKQKQASQEKPLPDDVRTARDSIDTQSKAFITAYQTKKTDEAEQTLKSMEEAADVIEKYLASLK